MDKLITTLISPPLSTIIIYYYWCFSFNCHNFRFGHYLGFSLEDELPIQLPHRRSREGLIHLQQEQQEHQSTHSSGEERAPQKYPRRTHRETEPSVTTAMWRQGSSRVSLLIFGTVALLILEWTTSLEHGGKDVNATASSTTSSVSDGFVVGAALPVNNTCLTASNQRGCSFPACEEWVCDQFDSCCEIAWTDTCVETALRNATLCFFVPPPRENNCFTSDPFLRPGCADETCESVVCELAPTCCTTSYGPSCIDLAVIECNLPSSSAEDGEGSCFERSRDGGPGCPDDTCLRAVCREDSSCCGIHYNEACAEIARNLGSATCEPIEYDNTCLEISPVGGCQEEDCELIVCDFDPGCCNSADMTGRYDDNCVRIASQSCPL
jgi:hypothetical protein